MPSGGDVVFLVNVAGSDVSLLFFCGEAAFGSENNSGCSTAAVMFRLSAVFLCKKLFFKLCFYISITMMHCDNTNKCVD